MEQVEKFEIIEKNKAGIIALCDQCDFIHIEIGTFTAVVSERTFEEICEHLVNRKPFIKELLVQSPSSKKILIPVSNNIFLTLNEKEFFAVVELFEISRHMLSAKKIMEL